MNQDPVKPYLTFSALFVAVVGVLFMGAVAINTMARYGLDWNFDPTHNSDIATFIASIAGTLFALTNAILLYASFQAQRSAIAQSEEQHQTLTRERQYEKLSERTQAIETTIRSYAIEQPGNSDKERVSSRKSFGFAAWDQAFRLWSTSCFPVSVEIALTFQKEIDNDNYLHDQSFILDTLKQLAYLIEDIKSSSLGERDKAFLLRRNERVMNRLARNKRHMRDTRVALMQVAEHGIESHPKRDYASTLLHIASRIGEVLELIPDLPERTLVPFGTLTVAFKKEPTYYFTSVEIPTLQIEHVEFKTQDRSWGNRIASAHIKIELEAIDEAGKQLYYQGQVFSLGLMIWDNRTNDPVYDTKGQWFVEGKFNELAGPPERHSQWRIKLSVTDMPKKADEELVVRLSTNASLTQSTSFTGING